MRLPGWLDKQVSLQILLVVLFLGAIALSVNFPTPLFGRPEAPRTADLQTPRAHQGVTPTVTSVSQEVIHNRDQTVGIVIGGVVMVVVVLAGTLLVIGRREKQ